MGSGRGSGGNKTRERTTRAILQHFLTISALREYTLFVASKMPKSPPFCRNSSMSFMANAAAFSRTESPSSLSRWNSPAITRTFNYPHQLHLNVSLYIQSTYTRCISNHIPSTYVQSTRTYISSLHISKRHISLPVNTDLIYRHQS